jgi:hypothetical protein
LIRRPLFDDDGRCADPVLELPEPPIEASRWSGWNMGWTGAGAGLTEIGLYC